MQIRPRVLVSQQRASSPVNTTSTRNAIWCARHLRRVSWRLAAPSFAVQVLHLVPLGSVRRYELTDGDNHCDMVTRRGARKRFTENTISFFVEIHENHCQVCFPTHNRSQAFPLLGHSCFFCLSKAIDLAHPRWSARDS